jgi:hypothetical protein
MPRYGDSDYDPDYDDSPPPSPKRRAFDEANRPSILRAIRLRLRRSRSIIFTFIILTILIYLWNSIKRPLFKPKHKPSLTYKNVNWKYYAYTQYATDGHHLCNAVMVFEALDRLGSKADRILMYPEAMDTFVSDARDRDSQLLLKAKQQYGVKLRPIKIEGIIKSGRLSL